MAKRAADAQLSVSADALAVAAHAVKSYAARVAALDKESALQLQRAAMAETLSAVIAATPFAQIMAHLQQWFVEGAFEQEKAALLKRDYEKRLARHQCTLGGASSGKGDSAHADTSAAALIREQRDTHVALIFIAVACRDNAADAPSAQDWKLEQVAIAKLKDALWARVRERQDALLDASDAGKEAARQALAAAMIAREEIGETADTLDRVYLEAIEQGRSRSGAGGTVRRRATTIGGSGRGRARKRGRRTAASAASAGAEDAAAASGSDASEPPADPARAAPADSASAAADTAWRAVLQAGEDKVRAAADLDAAQAAEQRARVLLEEAEGAAEVARERLRTEAAALSACEAEASRKRAAVTAAEAQRIHAVAAWQLVVADPPT